MTGQSLFSKNIGNFQKNCGNKNNSVSKLNHIFIGSDRQLGTPFAPFLTPEESYFCAHL